MTPRSLHVPAAVVAAALTAATVNVVQFPVLEAETTDWYEAVRIKPGHDLHALVTDHFASTQDRFSLYVQLRELAPGVRVVMPGSLDIYDENLRGLGTVTAVRRVGEQLTIGTDAAAALQEHTVASGEEQGLGAYVMALPDGDDVEEVVIVQGPDRAWVVARSLLDEVAPGLGP